MAEIESRLDDVIPKCQRDGIGILPSLLIRNRSCIEIRAFAEDDPAASNINGRRFALRTGERLAGRGRLAELEFVVAAELAAHFIDQP